MTILVKDSCSFFGSSLSVSQPLPIFLLQKLLKYVINPPSAPVTSCKIEPDALDSQMTFYDVKTEVLYS